MTAFNRKLSCKIHTLALRLYNTEEFAKNNPHEIASICEKLGITVNKDVIDESMKNSNLGFTDINDCIEEYNAYFSTIDTEAKGEKDEYKPLFVEKQ